MSTDARVRRFDVHACLGRGGFGEVYRATMTSPGGLKSTVALKVLRDDLGVEAQAVRRLRDEARLLGALHHPSIVAVHDLTQVAGRLTLVTEYIDGQDLDGCFSFGPGVPLKVLLEVIGRVASALDVAWNGESQLTGEPLRLVHRDIKPANIRIGRHGEVKLLDFGVARAAGVDRDASTHPDATVGTYRYLAPEVLAGATSAPPADVYALGITLFKGIAGEAFFDKIPLTRQVGLTADADFYDPYLQERLGVLPGVTPPEVVSLLRQMLAFDPAARPDAAAVAEGCDGLLDGLTGLDMRRWCLARTWPPSEAFSGPLAGKELGEQPLETSLDGTSHDKPFPSEVPTALLKRQPPPLPTEEIPRPEPGGGWLGTVLVVGMAGVAGGSVLFFVVALIAAIALAMM